MKVAGGDPWFPALKDSPELTHHMTFPFTLEKNPYSFGHDPYYA